MIVEEIVLPEGIQAEVSEHYLKVFKGDKFNERNFKEQTVKLEKKNSSIQVIALNENRRTIACAKAIVSHIKNMVKGLEKDFEYHLAVVYSHFPMNLVKKEEYIEINNFLGEKQGRKSRVLPGVEVQIKGKEVLVKGHNLEAVSQTAANLEQATRISGRDRRIYQDGIYIVKKAE